MSVDKGPDPVKPVLTFDNYIIPETVREEKSPPKQPRLARPHLAIPSVSIPKVAIPKMAVPKVSVPRPQMPNISSPIVVTPMMLSLGVIGLLTFMLGVLTALYFSGPEQPIAKAPADVVELAEAQTQEQSQVSPTLAEDTAAVTDPTNLQRVVSASLESDVTRQETSDLITPTGAMSRIDTSELSMAEILFGLTPILNNLDEPGDARGNTVQQNILNREKLRKLREEVLAGNYIVKTVERNGTQRLCLRLPGLKMTQDEAADMLRLAAQNGEIELPESLSTSDGDFDADTLIFNLVQTSLANDGTPEGVKAAREMSRRAFAASNAKISKENGERMYEVQSGDSLAYLSLQFYGQPSLYNKIFQANRKLLSSPDKIQVGQRLIIPG